MARLRAFLPILAYLAVMALVAGVTVLLVLYGQGFTYDIQKGRWVSHGLVIIQSTPSGAAVSMNGKNLKKKTAYHQALEVGSYTYDVVKSGFYPWHKVLSVVQSEVTLVQYVLLVPKNRPTTTLDTPAGVTTQSLSKDRHHVAYITSGPAPAVYLMDLSNPKPVKLYDAKGQTETQPAETLSSVSWSDDNSHVMVVSQQNGSAVYQLVPVGGGPVVNLTDQFHQDFPGLRFSAGNWRQLYWLSPEGLRRLDLEAPTGQAVSGVLADHVRQFQLAADRVLYVQANDQGESLWSLDARGHKQELIAALPDSDTYTLTYVSYRGEDELAVIPEKTGVGTLYIGIFGQTPVAKTVARDVNGATFSPDGHLLVFSGANMMLTYDLERSQLTGKTVTYAPPGVKDLANLSWYDNFHLLLTMDGHLQLMEFDGGNMVDLGAVSGALAAYSSVDLRSVVAVMPPSASPSPTPAGAAAPVPGAVQLEQITIRP